MATFQLFLGLGLLPFLAGYAASTPLDDYVNKPDPTYQFRDLGKPVRMDNYTIYYINMTSQTWLSSDLVSCSIWWHYLVVTIPDKLQFTDTAFIYVTGGDNNNDIPQVTSEDVLMSAILGFSTGTISATLFQVPNQPCVFSEDVLHKRRTEDSTIAFTWYHFLNYPDKPEYLLRLPMTKSVIRAMDTVATFASQKKPEANITKFAIAGASKRGWTTWTTGAVANKRVVAIVPIVEDALNLQKNLHHMFRAYGGWTFAFKDYYELNFTGDVDDPNMATMCSIVDPYAYRDRLTMPKLLINAGGDEFFLPDDNFYFWDDLPDPKYVRMVPNAEHSLGNKITSVLLAVRAFLLAVMTDTPFPKFNWKNEWSDSGASIVLVSDSLPNEVRVYHANTISTERRDFRLLTGADPDHPQPQAVFWYSAKLEPQISTKVMADGKLSSSYTYSANMTNPEKGWRAFFIQALFQGPQDSVFEFTTQVSIVPNTFPFPPCVGQQCRGKLV